jgi:hypothetical protein
MDVQTKPSDPARGTRYAPKWRRGAPGAGPATSSDLDDSTCTWTHFSRGFQIRAGKFEILTVAPDMDKSVMGVCLDRLGAFFLFVLVI